jgi:CheY-like chemotaxis protein
MTQINGLFLIDDDSIFNLIHTKTIEKVKFAQNVIAFDDPLNALKKLKELKNTNPKTLPDLIFLDINMPVMDGWQFLEELKNLSIAGLEHCKVIILSSSIDPSDIKKSKQYTMVYDFISKPLTPLKLSALSYKLENLADYNLN